MEEYITKIIKNPFISKDSKKRKILIHGILNVLSSKQIKSNIKDKIIKLMPEELENEIKTCDNYSFIKCFRGDMPLSFMDRLIKTYDSYIGTYISIFQDGLVSDATKEKVYQMVKDKIDSEIENHVNTFYSGFSSKFPSFIVNKVIKKLSEDDDCNITEDIFYIFSSDLVKEEDKIRIFNKHKEKIDKIPFGNVYSYDISFDAFSIKITSNTPNCILDSVLKNPSFFKVFFGSKLNEKKENAYKVLQNKLDIEIESHVESFYGRGCFHSGVPSAFLNKVIKKLSEDDDCNITEDISHIFSSDLVKEEDKIRIFNKHREKMMNFSSSFFRTIINVNTPKYILNSIITRNKFFNVVSSVSHELQIILCQKKFELNSDSIEKMVSFLPYLKGDKFLFCENFERIDNFISKSVDINKFYQYSLGISYDYITDMLNIINNSADQFQLIKNYFFTYIYENVDDPKIIVDNYLNLIKNYNKYPGLCLDLVQNNRILNADEKNNIRFLFNREFVLQEKDKPKTILDCNNIKHKIYQIFEEKLSNIDAMSLSELKDIICTMIMNDTCASLIQKLGIYGNTEEMIKLQFNNKKFGKVVDAASEMEVYTSFIEDVAFCNDKEKLVKVARNILNNYENILTLGFNIVKFEDKMRALYSLESEIGLTQITDFTKHYFLDKQKTEKYGVDVFDLSDKDYVIYAHVVSKNENITDLINGSTSLGQYFISFSPISYRNQVYYNNDGIILGYDSIPKENFICSSLQNMGTNGYINSNNEIEEEIPRNQRGVLETSTAKFGNNAETLCVRFGIKPKYIILPGGRKPTDEEINIAKKYGLQFAVTQRINTRIDNPQVVHLDNETESERSHSTKNLKEALNITTSNDKKTRKIAILSDPHALFEPTLAVLEDARKNGITEIYSLGDNIGTGPNPSEVLDLLEKYNVKSIKGNHELYVTEGVEAFREHLYNANAYREASQNSSWTRNQFNDNQIKNLTFYPATREILIGGKKILLCHSSTDFNNGKMVVNPENYERIFQGHIHFKRSDETNIETLRGVGIGYSDEDKDKAYYVILTEKENGGYDIEERLVPFDKINLEHSINLSDLNDFDKEKIVSWTKVGRTR